MVVLYIVFGILILCFVSQFVLSRLHIGEQYGLLIYRGYSFISWLYIALSLYWMPLPYNAGSVYGGLGILLGWGAYVVSLFILGTTVNKKSLFLLYRGIATAEERKGILRFLCKTIMTSFYEELFFRVCVLMLIKEFCGTIIAIIITAVYFLLAHVVHRDKKYYLVQLIDIFLLGLVLNIVYILTQSLLLCFVAHALRNCLVIVNNYMILLDRKKRKERLIQRGRLL